MVLHSVPKCWVLYGGLMLPFTEDTAISQWYADFNYHLCLSVTIWQSTVVGKWTSRIPNVCFRQIASSRHILLQQTYRFSCNTELEPSFRHFLVMHLWSFEPQQDLFLDRTGTRRLSSFEGVLFADSPWGYRNHRSSKWSAGYPTGHFPK